MMKIYRKIHKLSNVLKYFSSNEFRFDNDNVRKLTEKLDDRDKRLFSFDMRDLDWTNLFRVSLYGLRLYVVKDDPSNIPESKLSKNILAKELIYKCNPLAGMRLRRFTIMSRMPRTWSPGGVTWRMALSTAVTFRCGSPFGIRDSPLCRTCGSTTSCASSTTHCPPWLWMPSWW